MKRLIALMGATLMLSVGLAAPAQAATQNVTFDCSTLTVSQGRIVAATVGDTVNLTFTNCLWKSGSARYFPSAPPAGTPWVGTETITALGPPGIGGLAQVSNLADTATVTWSLRVSAVPAPAPAPAADEPGVTQVRQGVGLPEAGCEAVKDEEFAWGTGLTGGWVKSWQTWRRDDGTVFHDGWACIRVMENVDGEWRLADRRYY